MSIRPTIFVLALAAIAICCAVFLGPDATGRDRSELTERVLFDDDALPLDDIQTIRLTREGEQMHEWKRNGLEWTQVEPFNHPMLTPSIRRLITTARSLRLSHALAPGENVEKAALSLDPPLATIEFRWGDDEQQHATIHLGRRAVAGRAYLQLEGRDTIYIVDRPTLHERILDSNMSDWRHRRLFEHISVDGKEIAWATKSAEGSVGLVMKRSRRQWMMTEPVNARVDATNRNDYLEAIAKAACNGFVVDEPEQLDQFGLEDPAGVMTITMADQKTDTDDVTSQRLLIGAACGGGTRDRFAMISGRPVVFRISAETIGTLFRDPANLVDHTATGIRQTDVKRIVINGPSGLIELTRDLETWKATSHDDGEVDGGIVESLMGLLMDLRATGVHLMVYPQEMHVAQVTFYGYDAKPLDTVRIARDPQNGNWAFENGDNALRVHPPGMAVPVQAIDYGLSIPVGPAPQPQATDAVPSTGG